MHTVAIAIAALPVLFAAPPAGAASLHGTVFSGYDSFIDRFTILEEDTLETIHELRAGFLARASIGEESARGLFRNRFSWSNQTIDETFDGDLSLRPGENTRIELRGTLHLKSFREGSDYSFGNDYLQSNARLRIRRRLAGDLWIGWRSRGEIVDYEERTDFDYDYRYADTGLEIEGGSFFDRFLRVVATVGRREAPDTTELSYRRYIGEVEGRVAAGRGLIHLFARGDRREYDGSSRSDYWILDCSAGMRIHRDPVSWNLKLETEVLLYDRPDPTFFDTRFLRGGVRLRSPVAGGAAALFAEPRYAVMGCPDYAEERYGEGSVILGLDFSRGTALWLSASWEPGYRSYETEDNELYSDFSFNRLSLMGSAELGGGMTLSLFLSHDPEKHTRRQDDFSITLVSVELSRAF